MQAEGSFGVCGKMACKLWSSRKVTPSQAFTQRQKPTPYSHYQAATCPKSVKPYKQRFKVELVVAADHDEAGIKAAKASGSHATPKKQGYDWNDVFVEEGEEAVRKG